MAKNIRIGQSAVAGGTVDALEITLNPALTPYNTMPVFFRSSGPNQTTTPTADVNGDGAKTITKKGGEALVVGDIDGDHLMMYDLPNTRWELLNPASDATDTIWEESGGTVTLQTIANILRLGNGNTNWGQSPLEIYSTDNGSAALFIGDLGTAFLWLLQNSTEFQLLTSIGFELASTAIRLTALQGGGTRFVQTDNSGNLTGSNALPSGTTATTQAEGDSSTKPATTAFVANAVAKQAEVIAISCSDLTTNLATGTTKGYLRMPFAMTLTSVKASVIDAPTGSTIIVDINESGSTILSTRITIDASEKTSVTAATPPVISDAALANDAEITVDIDQVGSTNAGKGLIVYLIGTRA